MCVLIKLCIFLIVACSFGICDVHNSSVEIRGRSEILSRKKRFLIFPEGSSLQLVFCLTYPTIFAIGDIFLWGYTAALAYELPQDPYSPFNHKADPLHRRMDSKTINYVNEIGKVMYKVPYHRKPIVNPAFAKRSADFVNARQIKKDTLDKFKIDRKQMHASKHKREFLKSEHMDGPGVEFHRSSRSSLYQKIETLVHGLGGNGRQCMLKTLCLVGQTRDHPQGAFLHEILRAVFTLPKGEDDDILLEYDEAHSATDACDTLYPDCAQTIGDSLQPTFSY